MGPNGGPVARRLGQILGLLFLAGPISDLADADLAAANVAAIVLVLAVFVALARRCCRPCGHRPPGGPAAADPARGSACSALLAGARGPRRPESFAALFVYFVAAAGLAPPPAAGSRRRRRDRSARSRRSLATGASRVGDRHAHLIDPHHRRAADRVSGSMARTIRELRAAREELATWP